ncbi:unnamed protein product [Ectocarpus sp. CCAP 1310/34]|nr:unnamed protein product [Ectocarpus sp. CCAP 1310/34]
MGAEAKDIGVYPVVQLGEWGYAVSERRRQGQGQGQGQGRVEEDHCYPGLMCKVNRGGPCSEYEKKNRKCLHTLVVALALWQEEGMRDEGLGVGQVDVDGGRIPDGTPRTAQKMLDKDAPAYRKGLANCLNTMSVYKFPENLPFGLGRRGATTNANTSITYTTSQKTCSGCGRDFPTGNQYIVVATRLTEGPGMSKVNVHTNECETCGIHGLASDNWRETGLFNYNNSYLVELSILYRCLEAFTRGTTISAFFETFLEPLASDLVWIKANPDLSTRLANCTNLLNVLNIFLAFLALIYHTFEFRCWMWGKFPPILTFDACMKIACNFVTLGQVIASRPEQDINTVLIMNLLQLSMVSPAWFGGTRVQFVVGAGETVGNAPAWVSPDILLSEIFHKTQRGVLQGSNNTAFVEQGNGALLMERLEGKAIGDLSGMDVGTLKGHMKACWPDGGVSTFLTKEPMVSILQQLHSFWESDGNPNRGSCSKHFVSRERGVSEGVMGVVTPSKVMVFHKVLLTPESAVDMSDCVGACQDFRGCYMTGPKDLVLESVTA